MGRVSAVDQRGDRARREQRDRAKRDRRERPEVEALSGVGPKVSTARKVGEPKTVAIDGEAPAGDMIATASRIAVAEARPIGSVRATGEGATGEGASVRANGVRANGGGASVKVIGGGLVTGEGASVKVTGVIDQRQTPAAQAERTEAILTSDDRDRVGSRTTQRETGRGPHHPRKIFRNQPRSLIAVSLKMSSQLRTARRRQRLRT